MCQPKTPNFSAWEFPGYMPPCPPFSTPLGVPDDFSMSRLQLLIFLLHVYMCVRLLHVASDRPLRWRCRVCAAVVNVCIVHMHCV